MEPGPPETRPSSGCDLCHFGGICSRIPLLTRHRRSMVDRRGCRHTVPERRREHSGALLLAPVFARLTGGAAGCCCHRRGWDRLPPPGRGVWFLPPACRFRPVVRLQRPKPGPVLVSGGRGQGAVAAPAPGRAPTAASCSARPVRGLAAVGWGRGAEGGMAVRVIAMLFRSSCDL